MNEMTISTAQEATKLLNLFFQRNNSSITQLHDEIVEWPSYWTEWNNFKTDIDIYVKTIREEFSKCETDSQFQISEQIALETVIFNKLYDNIMPNIYSNFHVQDNLLFKKCLQLCKMNVSAEQLGAHDNFAIPLLAAVVELASWDKHKTPLEKLNCLRTTYDMIFAQLKSALVDIIANYSDNEDEIPVINNSDVIPVLMMVMVQSKLVHFYSNLYCIEIFTLLIQDVDIVSHILNSFKEAATRLQEIKIENLKPKCNKVCKDVDLMKLIDITHNNSKIPSKNITPLDRHVERFTGLINAATNAYQ